jgi:predicted permease
MGGRVVAVLYRLLLWLYPRRVRLNHGAEMVATVETEWSRRTSDGLRGIVGFVFWLVADIARSLPSQHIQRAARWIGVRSQRRGRQRHRSYLRWRERTGTALRDVRIAVRALLRSVEFSATAAVTLALAIGANTAVFSVVDRVLLRPLPYPESENLVVIRHPVPGYSAGEWGLSRAGYFYFKQNSRALQDLGVYRFPAVVLTGGGQPERVDAALITASVLSTLQVAPRLGRPISPDDDVPGAQPVVLLSHDLWMRRFGGDASIIGRTIVVDGFPEEVIGVMRRGFHFPLPSTHVWRPLRLDPNGRAINQHTYSAVGRLESGVTTEEALGELRAFVSRFTEEFPSAYSSAFMEESRFDVVVRQLLDDTVQNVRRALWIVLGTVAIVLLMACANVANLYLVRAEGRRREVALRTALGADRVHLLGHYLTESLVLATTAGIVGVGLAYIGVDLLIAFAPEGLPRIQEIGLDHRAVVIAGVLTVFSALFFGTFPLLRRSETNLTEDLKEGARSASPSRQRQRIRAGLVVSQVAMALLLLAASGLLFRSFLALKSVDLGFEPENVLTVRLSANRAQYPDVASRQRFFETARERLAELPMVSSVGMVWQMEIAGGASDNATGVADLPDGGETTQVIDTKFAGAGYFEAMGMRIVEGRFMERIDQDMAAPGAIITRSMAEEFWPGQSALGKRVRPLFRELPWHTVVGVIEDVRTEGIRKAPEPTVYFPYTAPSVPSMAFAIRATLPMSAIFPAVQREVSAIDPDVPLAEVATMERIVADDMASTTFTLSLLGLAAVMALVLGAVGIYGVVSYMVSQRTPEIGIRLALGARATQVGGMVLSHTMRLVLLGIGVGVGAALASNRVVNAVLFGVRPTDPATFLAVCLVLVGVAALAGYFPARRASRVDPVEALRAE